MKTIKVLQYNMGGMRSAAADAEHLMNQREIDVALLSEATRTPVHGYQRYDAGRAAILVKYGIECKMLYSEICPSWNVYNSEFHLSWKKKVPAALARRVCKIICLSRNLSNAEMERVREKN